MKVRGVSDIGLNKSNTVMGTPTLCTGSVDEDSAGWVASDQVADEGKEHEQSVRWCCEGQPRETLGKRSHQIDWQMPGERIHDEKQKHYS